MALTRAFMRETVREAIFLLKTPRETPRINSDCATLRAALAAAWSPEATTASTFFKKVRTRERRAALIRARVMLVRTRFFAWGELAMDPPNLLYCYVFYVFVLEKLRP